MTLRLWGKPVARPKQAYILLTLLAVLYLGLSLLLPTDAAVLARYNLTTEQARNLSLSVTLPYIIIWLVAFFGFIRLKEYSSIIKKNPDGKALSKISDGLFVLAAGLPIAAILNRILSYIGDTSPQLIAATKIATVYINLLIVLLAMKFIFDGAKWLVSTVKENAAEQPAHLVMISLAVIGTSYIYLTLTNPARQFPTQTGGEAAYYLPDLLILLTVIIPYLLAWYMGLKAAHYMLTYRREVKGLLYHSALGYLASGIIFVIISRIAIAYLASLNTALQGWALSYLLIFVYCLLVLIAAGFTLIATGANKLKKIEEV